MAVEDQEYFSLCIFNQTFQKRNANIGVEFAIENHKTQSPAIGNRRDHLAGKPLARNSDDWCLPNLAIRSSDLIVGADAHLVAPLNLSLFLSGFAGNSRIFFVEPILHDF